MTTNALRKKVIEYVSNAEPNVLEAVYKILQVIEGDDSSSLMTESQKAEVEKRSTLLRAGKLKTTSWADVKKNAHASRKK
ncbi:MAG: addiction module protein [Bacteroidota bacterium]